MFANKQALALTTKDGYLISGYQYDVPSNDSRTNYNLKPIIVVAGATAVAQRFYERFALSGTQAGFTVLTLDYRGVGESAPKSLNGFEMRYLQWATEDLAALVQHAGAIARSTNTKRPILLVGHSFGGHALGLLPNIDLIDGAYVFGTGAGWHGWMPCAESLKVRFLWSILAPILVRTYGYLPWRKLGLGEDLPIGVYRDWKHWCKFPRYFFDDPNMTYVIALFARFDKPLIAANAIDDKWAQPTSRDAFCQGYSNAKLTTIDINPKDYDIDGLEHMGYFKKNAGPVWENVFAWALSFAKVVNADTNEP